MANAQLNDIPLGMATPSRESGALDSEDHRVIDENVSFTAVAVETDKVVESLGSSHKARRNISSRQDDEMSLVDGTEEDVRQSWSDLDTKNPKRKRDDSVPSRKVFSAGAHKQPAVCGRQTSSPSTSFREETLAGKPVTEQTGEQLWSAPEPDPEPNPDSTSEQTSVQETCKPIERKG
ncbi:uncharacterized protein [Mytilus edulis]|uniref:uncharacterized protein n=1 Tax=Mytilus edulis TaxID=6550 RepID=UPI0039EF462E